MVWIADALLIEPGTGEHSWIPRWLSAGVVGQGGRSCSPYPTDRPP